MRARLKQQGMVLLAWLAIVGSLTPAFGPILDHHFAERVPDHSHIYRGSPDLHHRHMYEAPHTDDVARVVVETPAAGVVIIPAASTSRDGPVAELALASDVQGLLFPVPSFALFGLVTAANGPPPEAEPRPPFAPPRFRTS